MTELTKSSLLDGSGVQLVDFDDTCEQELLRLVCCLCHSERVRGNAGVEKQSGCGILIGVVLTAEGNGVSYAPSQLSIRQGATCDDSVWQGKCSAQLWLDLA